MAEFLTPQKAKIRSIATPSKENEFITIPPSPFLQKLGYGTGIAVYRMERSPKINNIKSPWAIKKLIKKVRSREVGQRLKNEAETLRKLKHPNIVGFRAFVKSADGSDCLAMEECSSCLGNLIDDRMENGLDEFPADQILKVGADIACALNYLHNDVMILHCDVKSHNVLIKGDFAICKLCDFGVCLPLTKEKTLDMEKYSEEYVEYPGTTLWAPCEVLEEEPVITDKADIFSWGLTLWEMLTLCPPHTESLDDSIAGISDEDCIIDISCYVDKAGKRPKLPSREFGKEYNEILQIFYFCTEEDYKVRPNASDLNKIMQGMLQLQGLK